MLWTVKLIIQMICVSYLLNLYMFFYWAKITLKIIRAVILLFFFIIVLLDRVFLRLGNADTDDQLESCLTRFLPPVILKLSSPHEQVSWSYFINISNQSLSRNDELTMFSLYRYIIKLLEVNYIFYNRFFNFTCLLKQSDFEVLIVFKKNIIFI